MNSKIELILKKLFKLQRLGIKVGLEHTKRLLEEIGNPHKYLKFIHIAGTNGKGTTCAILNKILIEHGMSVGLYTSPHLVRFNERIQINNEQISNEDIVSFMNKTIIQIKKINTTFFEATTAMAFDYFNKKLVDIAIIETGLGGRLDSTNVISPSVCAITSISFDHTDILGDSIEKITIEKAGIIKKNIPIVTFKQSGPIMDIITHQASIKKAPLFILNPHNIKIISKNKTSTLFEYKNYTIELPLKGFHQVINCILAIEVAKLFLKKLDPIKIKKAVKNTSWPGRMEKLSKDNFYYDVAHNYESIMAMVETVKENYSYNSLYGLFCLKGESSLEEICDIIKNNFSEIIICQDRDNFLLDKKIITGAMKKKNIKYLIAESVSSGVKKLKSYNRKKDFKLVFGSHYIAKEVYSEFEKDFEAIHN